MANSNEASRIAQDPQWQGRVSIYAHNAAAKALAENKDNQGQTAATWTKRQEFARAILAGVGRIPEYSQIVFNNPTLLSGADINDPVNGQYGVVDTTLEFAVEEQYNPMAGVDADDRATP